jgi:RHS repeat-associated protein
MVTPGLASAESLCTNTWVGPVEGSWTVAADWSAGAVPSSADVACIGSGKKVTVSEGTNAAGVLQGEGTVVVSGGSLEVANPFEGSTIHVLTLNGGTFTGAANVTVSGVLTWNGATMSGSGSTIVAPTASASLESFTTRHLIARTFVNEATAAFTQGRILMSQGAQIRNAGTFYADSQNETPQVAFSPIEGATPLFVNSGTFEKLGGPGITTVGVPFENDGTVTTLEGSLSFTKGGSSNSAATWAAAKNYAIVLGEGSFTFTGSTIKNTLEVGSGVSSTLEAVNASQGKVVSSGTLTIPSNMTFEGLTLNGGTLTGAATVTVSKMFTWNGATMSGSGQTVVPPGSSASLESFTTRRLVTRTFINEATTSFAQGRILMSQGAQIRNAGTFYADSQNESPQVAFSPAEGGTPLVVNSGTFEKLGGPGTTTVGVPFENDGTVQTLEGSLSFTKGGSSNSAATWAAAKNYAIIFAEGAFTLSGSTIKNTLEVSGGTNVTLETVTSSQAKVVSSGTLTIPSNTTFEGLTLNGGTLTGSGTVTVPGTFTWNAATMSGSGATVVPASGTVNMESFTTRRLVTRTLVNEATAWFLQGRILMSQGAEIKNRGTFYADSQNESPQIAFSPTEGASPLIINSGTFEKLGGPGTTSIGVAFENWGVEKAREGHLEIRNPIVPEVNTQYGSDDPSAFITTRSLCGKPVDCVTGNETETQTDLSVGGRGIGLDLTRNYNAQAAAKASSAGMFGYGWSSSFSDHLLIESSSKRVTLVQANGGTVSFAEGAGGMFTPPAWSGDTLTGSVEAGYTVTLADQTKYAFSGSSSRLESVEDRDGNKTTLSYNEKGQLASITDPAGRKIKLTYNAGGEVESAEDPMGHIVKYAYEGGNLTSVTLPGETSPNWRFKYDTSHRMTLMIDGRGGETTNTYDGASRVLSQKDPLGHVMKFAYEPFQTKITNEATGAVTFEEYNSGDLITTITHGYGTTSATTSKIAYNEAGELTSVTDGNGHTTSYEYDGAGNKTKMVDAANRETKWTYNGTHDVMSVTRPNGEKTTITRDEHGNPTVVSRPAPGETTQEVKYEYNGQGEPTSMTDPLGHKWSYEYDTQGDKTSETDPEGDERIFGYNEDSQLTSIVSPRGNVEGGEPAKYTTTIERDARGRKIKVIDPRGKETRYSYDPNSNLTAEVDANSHETKISYDADNHPIKVTKPDGAVSETGYDGAGAVTSQTDGNLHTTKYVRNVLEQVTEVVDPLVRKTTKTYDAAGNLETVKDPAGRTTTYTYDKANELAKISYSDGITPAVEYEYDEDGNRILMIDGTGKTTYSYDQLDRLTKVTDGHGSTIGYEYDLANEQTKITYPNTKTVERGYDKAGRLASVKDWLEHTTTFAYDPNSNLTAITFPIGINETDHYAYNEADQQTEAKMSKGEEVLASLAYTRDNIGQVTKTVNTGLPGPETVESSYDENERLNKAGGSTYEYDPANNPTTLPGSTNTFDAANEMTEGTGVKYSYDEEGERTKTTPTVGPATTYGYSQAGNLTSVSRPEEGETPKIEDSYGYNGDGLRISETIGGTANYLTWDASSVLPLLLNDGGNSYVYGPKGMPVEQINNEEAPTYLHHDQQGSTRLLTNQTGITTGAYTYTPYGATDAHTGTAATPLGYSGQYTSSDTDLIYLRGRVYDPATTQFMSADPIEPITQAPYFYANDNPLNWADTSGLLSLSDIGEGLEEVGGKVIHAGLDIAAVVPYGVYYASYYAAKGINEAGCNPALGPVEPVACALAKGTSAPLAGAEALGLAGDVAIDELKGELSCDEGERGYINPLHSFLPSSLRGPKVYLPGIHRNGSVDFEW